MKATKIYIIAGEASGDLHGSNLIKALLDMAPETIIRFWGGDLMASASGNKPVRHYEQLAYMGIWEVLKHLPAIRKNIQFCKSDIRDFHPDTLLLIDYPGFNLRIAEWAHNCGILVQYYISPKIWAWNTSRVHKIQRIIDRMYVILPFEEAFYQKYGYKVQYVGNPLLDEMKSFEPDPNFNKKHNPNGNKIIALLPGSRKQEIRFSLPIMLEACSSMNGFQYCIAVAPSIPIEFYRSIIDQIAEPDRLSLVIDDTYNLLNNAKMALVTSGTATLEAALLNVPQVVCYKTNRFTYWLGKRLIKVPFISLVNLILGKDAVRELIQSDFNVTRLKKVMTELMEDDAALKVRQDYAQLKQILGKHNPSQLVAQNMLDLIGIRMS